MGVQDGGGGRSAIEPGGAAIRRAQCFAGIAQQRAGFRPPVLSFDHFMSREDHGPLIRLRRQVRGTGGGGAESDVLESHLLVLEPSQQQFLSLFGVGRDRHFRQMPLQELLGFRQIGLCPGTRFPIFPGDLRAARMRQMKREQQSRMDRIVTLLSPVFLYFLELFKEGAIAVEALRHGLALMLEHADHRAGQRMLGGTDTVLLALSDGRELLFQQRGSLRCAEFGQCRSAIQRCSLGQIVEIQVERVAHREAVEMDIGPVAGRGEQRIESFLLCSVGRHRAKELLAEMHLSI